MTRVDFIMPCYSQYGVLHYFTEKLYDAFGRQGVQCRLLTSENFRDKLLESPPDLTIAFNSILRESDKENISDCIKKPHLACLVDPPYNYPGLFDSPYIFATCEDRTGSEFVRRRGFPNRSVFMPHAVEPELHANPADERPYDVVLLGSFGDPAAMRKQWRLGWSLELALAMEEAAAITLSDQKTPFTKAFLFKSSVDSICDRMYWEVERYLKAYERLELLKSIRDAKVHVFGSGAWEQWAKENNPDIIVHPEVSFPEALEIMKKTKILICPNIKNKYGAHERIFAGMACGALPLTNDNVFLRESFQDGVSIAFYQNNAMDRVNDQIVAYLKNEENRRQVVLKGQGVVRQSHTWDSRAADLVKDLRGLGIEL